MNESRKFLYLRDTEHAASKIIASGNADVDEAIQFLGRVIDRTSCKDTIKTCEKLIEILNEGPQIRTINQLSYEQAAYASRLMAAVAECVTLHL